MTQTNWADAFADLDYPGRRKPLNRSKKQDKSESSSDWDSKPLKYMVNGEEREFFTIGHLSKALGYSVPTIRAWENRKLLPKSRYRSPSPKMSRTPEIMTKGKRLWTRAQIEGILRLSEEEGVILNKKPPTHKFALRVQELFNNLIDNN